MKPTNSRADNGDLAMSSQGWVERGQRADLANDGRGDDLADPPRDVERRHHGPHQRGDDVDAVVQGNLGPLKPSGGVINLVAEVGERRPWSREFEAHGIARAAVPVDPGLHPREGLHPQPNRLAPLVIASL